MELTKNRMDRNVNEMERLASVIGGGALLAFGLGKRNWAGAGLVALGGGLVYRGVTGHCDVYQQIGVNTARDRQNADAPISYKSGIRVDHAVTVNKSPAELFSFWRHFENLPRFMNHLVSVHEMDDKRSHWAAKAPLGRTVEWDAEIIHEEENRLISWRSLPGADVDNAGSVHFDAAPDGRGTVVKVELQYNPPAGALGAAVARLFGEEPNVQIREDMARFKQLMETGEIATTEGQSSGRSKDKAKVSQGKDFVTHSSEESFPASDPPSWTPEALPGRS